LAEQFAKPAHENKPWVFWFWNNGNITEHGIRADLKAMNDVGIGGVLIMEVGGQGAPEGPVEFLSDEWRRLFKLAVNEAAKYGIQINMNNDAGWNGSGGRWITPAEGMQLLVWSETKVPNDKLTGTGTAANAAAGTKKSKSPATVSLAEPKRTRGYYRDIALYAFPTPAGDPPRRAPNPNNPRLPKPEFQRAVVPANAVRVLATASRVEGMEDVAQTWELRDGAGATGVALTKKSAGAPLAVTLALPPSPTGSWTLLRLGHTVKDKLVGPAPTTGAGLECDKLSVKAAESAFNGQIAKLAADNRALAGAGKTLVSTHIDSWENGSQTWTPLMREEFLARRRYDLLPFLPVIAGGYIIGGPDRADRFLWDFRQTVNEMVLDNYAGTFARLAHANGLRLSTEAYDAPCDYLTFAGTGDEPTGEFWTKGGWNAQPGTRLNDCRGMASAAHLYGRRIVGVEAFTEANTDQDRARWVTHPGTMKALGDRAFAEGVNRIVFHRYSFQPWGDNLKPGLMMGPWGTHYERTQTWWRLTPLWHQYLARAQFLLRQGDYAADIAHCEREDPPNSLTAKLNPPRAGYSWDKCGATQVRLMTVNPETHRLTMPAGANYAVLVLPNDPLMTPALIEQAAALARAGATILGGTKPPAGAPGLADLPRANARVAAAARELWGENPGTTGERRVGKGRFFWGTTAEKILAADGVPPAFSATDATTGEPLDDRAVPNYHRRDTAADIFFVANTDPARARVLNLRLRATGGGVPQVWNPETGTLAHAPAWRREADGLLALALPLGATESAFIVIPRTAPACGTTGDRKPITTLARNTTPIFDLDAGTTGTAGAASKASTGAAAGAAGKSSVPPIYGQSGSFLLRAPGTYTLRRAGAADPETHRLALPPPVTVSTPWTLTFPLRAGEKKLTLPALASWHLNPDPDIQFFSGTATYTTTITLPADLLATTTGALPRRLLLDLGEVREFAEVTLNGTPLPVQWKIVKELDVTGIARAGENVLEIRVTNLWPNRLIGDERQYPPVPGRIKKGERVANARWRAGEFKQWPAWLYDGKKFNDIPDPSGRHTFVAKSLYLATDPLLPSGLLGPVRFLPAAELK
ncbi:MAG: hypothetical protein LBR07_01470, partial [Puniceicoccales bacterium]|nr:hypothetical protein [Puniceicoccales bacterium]